MKKVIGILALLALVSNVANAQLLKNFKYDGKIEVNTVVTNNIGDLNSDSKDRTSDTDARIQVNAGFDVAEDVTAAISVVKCNREYGDATTKDDVDTLTAAEFEQAYIQVDNMFGLTHKIGRQYYGNEGDLVFYAGPKSFPYDLTNGGGNALSVSGLDGYSGWYKGDLLNLHVVSFKQADNDAANYADTDVNINGIAGSYKLSEKLGLGNLLNVGAYVYEKKTMGSGTTDNETLDVVGVKADGKLEALNLSYYGELAKNYGNDNTPFNYTGNAILLGGSMDVNLVGKWTFMGEILRASGDKGSTANKDEGFTPIASDYRRGIIWGGILGKGADDNLTAVNLGAKWNTPMFEKLTLGANLYNFTVTEDSGLTYDAYGNEFDLCANWQHNEAVGVKAYFGMFMPDKKYVDATTPLSWSVGKDDMATAIGAALTVKFGS